MDIIIIAVLMGIAFIGVVSAYLMGVSHGMRVSNRNIPHPIKEATQVIKEQIAPTPQEPDLIDEIMNYDYAKAFESVKKQRLEVKR